MCLITALHLIHNSHGGREIRAATLVSTQKEQIWAAMQIARKVPSFEKKKRKEKGGGGAFALKEQFTQKKFSRLRQFAELYFFLLNDIPRPLNHMAALKIQERKYVQPL